MKSNARENRLGMTSLETRDASKGFREKAGDWSSLCGCVCFNISLAKVTLVSNERATTERGTEGR